MNSARGPRDAAQGAARFPGWSTDFARRSVGLGEFKDGGPPRDGIPPIDHPRVVTQRQGDRFVDEREPVMVVEQGAAARAYPLQILVWHEIVNDRLAGRPIAVTYCPLCNSGVVFDRRVDGHDLTFGTTGKLRRSDLVMWDRQTQSWWQQFSGEALVGTLTGKRLRTLANQTLSWQDFKHIYPHGTVLSRDTGFVRDYGRNPYEGYDADPNGITVRTRPSARPAIAPEGAGRPDPQRPRGDRDPVQPPPAAPCRSRARRLSALCRAVQARCSLRTGRGRDHRLTGRRDRGCV